MDVLIVSPKIRVNSWGRNTNCGDSVARFNGCVDYEETPSNANPSTLIPLDQYLRGRGLTRTTGYRYRRKGLITAVNIYGRLYLTKDEIKRFEERAIRGEFSLAVRTPGHHTTQNRP